MVLPNVGGDEKPWVASRTIMRLLTKVVERLRKAKPLLPYSTPSGMPACTTFNTKRKCILGPYAWWRRWGTSHHFTHHKYHQSLPAWWVGAGSRMLVRDISCLLYRPSRLREIVSDDSMSVIIFAIWIGVLGRINWFLEYVSTLTTFRRLRLELPHGWLEREWYRLSKFFGLRLLFLWLCQSQVSLEE